MTNDSRFRREVQRVVDLGNAAQIRLRDEVRKEHHKECKVIQAHLDKAADALAEVAAELEAEMPPIKPRTTPIRTSRAKASSGKS